MIRAGARIVAQAASARIADATLIIKRSNRFALNAPSIFHDFDFQKQQVI
jgi:hypothetical protein